MLTTINSTVFCSLTLENESLRVLSSPRTTPQVVSSNDSHTPPTPHTRVAFNPELSGQKKMAVSPPRVSGQTKVVPLSDKVISVSQNPVTGMEEIILSTLISAKQFFHQDVKAEPVNINAYSDEGMLVLVARP